MAELTTYLVGVLAAAVLYMTLWYAVSRALKRADVADIAWGLGFAVIAWTAYGLGGTEGSNLALIINVLVTIWGVRLAAHIFLRNRGKPEDKRYIEMREKWGSNAALQTYLRVFLGALNALFASCSDGYCSMVSPTLLNVAVRRPFSSVV